MSKKGRAKARTYEVIYERDEAGVWVATVKGVSGVHTQGRTLAQARERIREALSLVDDHAGTAALVDNVRLPASIGRMVGSVRSVRSKQESLAAKLRQLNVQAARALTKQVGLSLRDAGELLGASQEAVRQWVDADV
jgi:predicted RNase H-like HicB family nuclease